MLIAAQIARARMLIAQDQPAAAEGVLTEAQTQAHKLDNRRLLAEALSARSQQQAALGHPDESAAAWEEAQRGYAMLHMPQAKLQPAWLTRSPTRP